MACNDSGLFLHISCNISTHTVVWSLKQVQYQKRRSETLGFAVRIKGFFLKPRSYMNAHKTKRNPQQQEAEPDQISLQLKKEVKLYV